MSIPQQRGDTAGVSAGGRKCAGTTTDSGRAARLLALLLDLAKKIQLFGSIVLIVGGRARWRCRGVYEVWPGGEYSKPHLPPQLFTTRLHILTPVAEALKSFLFPFEWDQVSGIVAS